MSAAGERRGVGLLGATGVGIGAIVGGGILVLAGVAFARTGPGALVAFGLNGLIALVTAFSFAELASSFPESGGAYTFAKKVLSVRAAFAAGWTLWFAYIVAGAMYALGFAYYANLVLETFWHELGGGVPRWLTGRTALLILGFLATAAYAAMLSRRPAGGRQWATVGKVVVFAAVILAGGFAVLGQPRAETLHALTPFFSGGFVGLAVATGLTFIALQGFEIIAAIGGEVKDAGRTVPRAMFLSLFAALIIYLPLLFIVSTVGVSPGGSIADLARGEPETAMAVAVRQFMGPSGYWLVVAAAILSTLSALGANVLAASRIAFSMANDRTLPTILRRTSKDRDAPVMAITTSALIICALLMMMPDLTAAGSAASLIFLVAFTLAHVTAILARRRGGGRGGAFRTPFFPLLPGLGAFACAGLALFQAVMVPAAGVIALFWLGLGVIFYLSLFASRAELLDASAEAYDPDLVRLRGRSPLVLLPIANPKHAASMVAVANTIASPVVGRVLVLTIVSGDEGRELAGLGDAQKVIAAALTESHATGHKVEALVTTAPAPWAEIERIASEHRCESLLLGIGELKGAVSEARIEALANNVDCDVAILRAPLRWQIEAARRVLVPMGGRGEQHALRARMLGSLLRGGPRDVTFVRVVQEAAGEREVEAAFREVERKAEDSVPGDHRIEIVQSDDPEAAILEEARSYDLIVLGFHRDAGRARFGAFATRILQGASCATIVLSAKQ